MQDQGVEEKKLCGVNECGGVFGGGSVGISGFKCYIAMNESEKHSCESLALFSACWWWLW